MLIGKSAFLPLVTALALVPTGYAASHSPVPPASASAPITVNGELPKPPQGVTDLKFGELFMMPVGPLGLKPTEKLLGLDGRRVRIVGYLARQDVPTPGCLYLAPFPIQLGDEDEPLADDLPPNMVFVHMPAGVGPSPSAGKLVSLIGKLAVGAKEEPDGRVSSVRLIPDPEIAGSLRGIPPPPDGKPTGRATNSRIRTNPVK